MPPPDEGRPPCFLHEDEDLLVSRSRPGSHAPARRPLQEGIHEWASARRGKLGLHHRLDKDTSGVLVMSRTPRGAKHLTEAFEGRAITKRYAFLTTARERPPELHCDDRIGKPRNGVAALDPKGAEAWTDFTVLERRGELDLVEARPARDGPTR